MESSEDIGPTDKDGPVKGSEPSEPPKPTEDNTPTEDIAPLHDDGPLGEIEPPNNDSPGGENAPRELLEQPKETVPRQRIMPREDIGPPDNDDTGEGSAPRELLKQPEEKEIMPREDIERPDSHGMLAPPGKDRRQSAATVHENQDRGLSQLKGKKGAYVYKPGTSALLFIPEKRLDDSLNESKGETLLKAVHFGHEGGVALLLKANAWTECRDEDGRTPLLCAVEENNIVIVKLLLENKADWNAKDKSGRTALHLASLNGRTDIVRRLLEIVPIDKDAEGIDKDAQDEQFETPLHLAIRNGHQSTIKLLLEAGANVNATDKRGFTPLHMAAARRGPTLVKMMLGAKDIQVDARATNGRTPLMQACDRISSLECEEVVKLLLNKGADAAACDHNGETPVFLSAWAGNWENLVQLLSWKTRPIEINALTIDKRSALFGPARFGFPAIAKLLLEAGINSTIESTDGRTAWLESAKYDKVEVSRSILESLVKNNGQAQEKLVQVALFEAARYDSSQVAAFLLDIGAKMNAKEETSQKTAVEIANEHSSQRVVAVLLAAGDQLVSQGPSLKTQLPEAPSKAAPKPVPVADGKVDLGFGFQATIASFSFDDTHENYGIARPTLRSVLYDHSPTAIKTGLQVSKPTGENFRWLHVPSNNVCSTHLFWFC
jgi:ankyrin repeat protein